VSKCYNHLDTSDGVDPDQIVTVSAKQGRSISRPCQAGADGNLSKLGLFRAKSVNDNLGLQIPNLDTIIGGGTQPVTVRAEAKRVNNLSSIQRIKTLAFVQVPEHGGSILSSRGTEGAIRGDTDSVEVTRVSHKIVAELAVGKGKDLDKSVPSARNNQRDRLGRAEANARDPVRVPLGLSGGDGVLAFSESVPELDALVAGSRNNLTIVNGKGHRKNILSVSDKTTSRLSGMDLPKSESAVPRSTQGELAITGDDNVRDKVRVSSKGTTGVSVLAVGARAGEGPHDDALVARRREEQVGVLRGGGEGSDPVTVALESSAQSKSFRHGRCR
jgi:hypothetical protein